MTGEDCRRCGGLLPRSLQQGDRWVPWRGDVCAVCESGRTLAYCDEMIPRTEAMLALMEGSNAVLTNPEFLSVDDGEARMYAALVALGYDEWIARQAVAYGAGKLRYDAQEIQSTREDLSRLIALRSHYLSTARV